MVTDTGIYIWEFGADFFESALFILFLNYFHYDKTRRRGRTLAAAVAGLALFLNILISDLSSVYSVWPVFADLLILTIYSRKYLPGAPLAHLLSFTLFYLGMFLSIAGSALLFRVAGGEIGAWLDIRDVNRPLFLLVSKLLLFAYCGFVLKVRGRFYCLPNRLTKLSYVLVPFLSFTVGLWIIRLIFIVPPARYVRETLLLMLIFLLLLLAFILYLSVYAVREMERECENRALVKVLEIQKEAVKSMEEGRTELWKLTHDIGHRMVAIRYFFRNGEEEKGMEELERLYRELNGTIETAVRGENLGCYLAGSKLGEAKNQGITVSAWMAPGLYQSVDPIDLSIILGNLLDNAIEAQQGVERGRIDFIMDESFGCIFIEVKNTCSGSCTEGRLPRTKKKEPVRHGYGLSSVRELIEKNGGKLELSAEGKEFRVRVLLMGNMTNPDKT